MKDRLTHIYLMPGLAASPSIFENFSLPEENYRLHRLEWLIPEKTDTLESYAKKMNKFIEFEDSVLLGVSFGGVLVQEMSKYLQLKKLIVVSSVKSKHEIPKRLKILKTANIYKILPTSLVSKIDVLAKMSLGDTITKRLELYQQYLSVNDPQYLDWAIREMIFWDQEKPNPNALYIHGDNDMIFPYSCQGNCIVVEGGTHIMVINRFRWFNENLPKIINGTFNNYE